MNDSADGCMAKYWETAISSNPKSDLIALFLDELAAWKFVQLADI